MRRIQDQKENVIQLKKTWNENKNMKPWCLILNFLDFIKQNYIDFLRKLDWFPLKPLVWTLVKFVWEKFFKPANNYLLPCKTFCGNGLGKKLQDQLKTFFHLIWRYNGTIGWALHAIFSCLNMLFALYNNLVPWTCTLQLAVHAEHSNCLFWK